MQRIFDYGNLEELLLLGVDFKKSLLEEQFSRIGINISIEEYLLCKRSTLFTGIPKSLLILVSDGQGSNYGIFAISRKVDKPFSPNRYIWRFDVISALDAWSDILEIFPEQFSDGETRSMYHGVFFNIVLARQNTPKVYKFRTDSSLAAINVKNRLYQIARKTVDNGEGSEAEKEQLEAYLESWRPRM